MWWVWPNIKHLTMMSIILNFLAKICFGQAKIIYTVQEIAQDAIRYDEAHDKDVYFTLMCTIPASVGMMLASVSVSMTKLASLLVISAT